MARFTGGWIKLWRKAVEGDLADNIVLWGLWNWLLYAATWKPSSIIWKGERRDIPPGTVVLGISDLAEKWKCSQSTIKKWLAYLQRSERISMETCSRGTLVTICNWDVYQANDAIAREQGENQVRTECEPSENQVGLSKEGKKGRIEESNTDAPEKKFSSGEVAACIDEWRTTLKHFEITRPIGMSDEIAIGAAVSRFGSEWVKLAFQGARKQTSSGKFNPKNFVSLSIYLHKDKIERLVNIGSGKENSSDIDWSKVFSGAA